MHHGTARRSAPGVSDRVHIGAGGVRVHIGRERHHRLQPDKKSAGPQHSRRELRRDLGGAGAPRRRHEDTGFGPIVLLHPDLAGPQGTIDRETVLEAETDRRVFERFVFFFFSI